MTDTTSRTGRAVARVWTWRRELAVTAGVAATAGVPLAIPRTRRLTRALYRSARTRRLLHAGFSELRFANAAGRMPRVGRVRPMPFGERVELRVRPGQWMEVFEFRAAALAAATRAATVRVDKDPDDASRVMLDVVRLDPLAGVGDIPWLGLGADELSMWDPIHVGRTEMGEDLHLDPLGRGHLLVAGLSGSGKSTFLRPIASHAAKSRCHMVLIDPNRVQFAPWRARALAYASQDPAEALAALDLVIGEVDRRLDLLESLPGCPEKVTREIAEVHGLPPWLLIIDELAYHTSVAGSGVEQKAFSTKLRDILSRCRAAGMAVVAATQRPTGDIVPTSLSGLFAFRLAFNVQSGSNSDVILGEGWVKRGYNAAEISVRTPGVGLLLAEKSKPQKFKSVRIPTSAVMGLSVTTVPMRPQVRPGLRVVADVA